MKSPAQIDRTLTMVVLALLLVGCFLVLQPFLTAIIWALILCATIWPLFIHLRNRLKGRSGIAALAIVLLMAVTVLAPFVIVGITIADNAEAVSERLQEFLKTGPPPPPEWVASIPIIGEWASTTLGSFAHDTARLLDAARQFVEPVRKLLYAGGATLLGGILQLALSIFIAFFFLRDGDALLERMHAAIERIAPERGRRLAGVAATTVRGVVLGILGTALAQGVLMAIGLWLAGFKAAPLLGLVTFFLSPVPIGPPLVWIPAGILLIHAGRDRLGHLPHRVGRARRLLGRQLLEADDHQPRQRTAVRARAPGRPGRRDRVRLCRCLPGPGAARGWLCAHQGVGGERAVRRRPGRRRGGTRLAGSLNKRPADRPAGRRVTRDRERQIGVQKPTPFLPLPDGGHERLIIARRTERSIVWRWLKSRRLLSKRNVASVPAGQLPSAATGITQNAAGLTSVHVPGQVAATNAHSAGSDV